MSEGPPPAAQANSESPDERAARLSGEPYLIYRDHRDREHVVSLHATWDSAAIGRNPGLDVVLSWDGQVSAIHAELERLGEDWLLVDDGLSRNGSFVNGERLQGRRRLRDGDELRFGETAITYHAPFQVAAETIVHPQPSSES